MEYFCLIFSLRFIVFVTYQMYYDYPPPTYLEYPILIAQGEFQNQNTVSPDVIEMLVVTVKSRTCYIILSGLCAQTLPVLDASQSTKQLPVHVRLKPWHYTDICVTHALIFCTTPRSHLCGKKGANGQAD